MGFGDRPRVCCFRARSVVIFFSIMSLIVCIYQSACVGDYVTQASGIAAGLLECVLLWGVIKHTSKLLKIAMYISLIHLTFDFGTILVSPVYIASQVASGYTSNDSQPIIGIIFNLKTREEDRFVLGLIFGYTVEIISTISVFLGILQFCLINRCYVYAKLCEETGFKKFKLTSSVIRF